MAPWFLHFEMVRATNGVLQRWFAQVWNLLKFNLHGNWIRLLLDSTFSFLFEQGLVYLPNSLKNPQNLYQILRFLKLFQIFWKCVFIKISWKNLDFYQANCIKIFSFFVRKLAYQQTLRILQFFFENLTNFCAASKTKFRKFWYE